MSYGQDATRDARLRVLQSLRRQRDGRLSDVMVEVELDNWGHRRSREAVRTLMRDLAELDAVTLPVDNAAVMVAELTRKGRDHVERRGTIDGVRAPEPGE